MLLRWKTEEGIYIDRLVEYVGANRRREGGTTEGGTKEERRRNYRRKDITHLYIQTYTYYSAYSTLNNRRPLSGGLGAIPR